MNTKSTGSELTYVLSLLKSLGLKPSKAKGQNFLIDRLLAETLVCSLDLTGKERVLEIGPGSGVMTERLAKRSRTLKVVEIEDCFIEALKSRIEHLTPENIFVNDIRNLRLEEIFPAAVEKVVVVSNVPYSISSDIILWIMRERQFIDRAGLLLQKEFAERLAARPGSKAYSSLTVMCQLFADVVRGEQVSPEVFYPRPTVDSQWLRINFLPAPREDVDFESFERLVRAAFSKRRKTLLNCLHGSGIEDDKLQLAKLITSAGIDPEIRGEMLSVRDFAALTRIFYKAPFG